MGESARASRIKARRRPAIRSGADPARADDAPGTGERVPGADAPAGKIVPFPENARIVCGYQYHAPKMRARDKLREIIKILKK